MTLVEENAAVLLSLGHDPAGPAAPRLIDFNLVFARESARAEAARFVTRLGFGWRVSNDPVDVGQPEAVASKNLAPTAVAITDAELALDQCLAAFDGRTDGWGFFNETKH